MYKTNCLIIALLGTCGLLGCNPGDAINPSKNIATQSSPTSLTMDEPPPEDTEVHSHPSEGPHHGSLIELGQEEYHAELVHDEKSVTIYILDSAATTAVPIDATELVINLMHDGKPKQFKLAASPNGADSSGKSSRFTLQDAELVEEIDHDDAAPKLSVSIAGKSYRGNIKHDHAGHDHDH
jgi:hypothetical protein